MAKTTLEVIAELLNGLWTGLTGQLENLTDGTQKTKVVDNDGDVAGISDGALHTKVDNLPTEYPLPSSQVTTFTPPAAITGFATATNQTNGSQMTMLTDGESAGEVAQIVTGFNTGVKGLRVFGGPTDPISDIPVYIDFAHHQIHEGETWKWHFYGAVNSTTRDIRISVPVLAATTRTPHLMYEVIADNTTTIISFYEGTTWTSGGTNDSARILNRNRNIGGTPNTKIYVTGATALTVNALGTQLDAGYLFTGKASVNTERNLTEWDLKSNTEYLLRIVTSASGNVLIKIHFYEDLGV